MTFHFIPHTHWDREWYLPLPVFQARLVTLIDDALDRLERDETLRVTLDGQTVLLEDYLTYRPEAESRIRAQVARGALEIGPWYVLGDELIPSGESLIRNLLEGNADGSRFGGRSMVLYSPDAFGHPAVLPAIAREFGLSTGALWRGMGNPHDEDRDLYRWQAHDGSELLVYHLPAAGYEVGIGLSHDPSIWPTLRDSLHLRAVTDQVAVFTGADHHAVPDLTRVLEVHADIRISTLGEYMQTVGDAAAAMVRGELRRTGHTWVLQGVHGTRSRMKRAHGTAELMLSRIAEPLVALGMVPGGTDYRPVLRRAWRLLLQSQFHDTIGGCSVDAVAKTQQARLDDVARLAREASERGFDALLGHDPDAAREAPGEWTDSLALWNPAARNRGGIVTAELALFRRDVIVGPPNGRVPRHGPGYEPLTLMAGVEAIPVQVLAVRPGMERLDARRHSPDQDEVDRVFVAFQAPDLPGLATRTLALLRRDSSITEPGVTVADSRLSNRFIDVRVSAVGVIDLADLESGERYPGLAMLEDETDTGDSYTFARGPGRPVRGGRALSQTVLASGPLVGAIETQWELAAATGGVIAVQQVVVMHDDSPLLRVRLEIDNRASDHRLRARFPVDAGHEALAGAAFGWERRGAVEPDTRPGLIERPVLTAPSHRYVAAGEGKRGLALFAPGFFEYEWTPDHELLFTLTRSIGELSRADLAERPGHAGWPEPIPEAQEPGVHRIELAIMPISGETERPEELEAIWEDAFLPLQARWYRDFTGEAPWAGFTLEGRGLVMSAVKPGPDDSIVLRCWNAREVAVEGRWLSAEPIAKATRIRADESEIEVLTPADPCVVPFLAGPRSIVTIAVSRET